MNKTLVIVTWNINSVRLRLPLIKKFLQSYKPDILCLQEIKCENSKFPKQEFTKLGYSYMAIAGQKSYHGVATISKYPLYDIYEKNFCKKQDKRHIQTIIETSFGKIGIHNFYVPAGGEVPDININEKFAHKLNFLQEMKKIKSVNKNIPYILLGDLNIAPLPKDVWSHKKLLKVVSHTPVETEMLLDVMEKGGWQDSVRHFIPAPKKLFTWWSYRAKDWQRANRGRRLDHIWLAGELLPKLKKIAIIKHARRWQKPSDHVPIIASFKF